MICGKGPGKMPGPFTYRPEDAAPDEKPLAPMTY